MDAGNLKHSDSFVHLALGRRQTGRVRRVSMTREAEAEAWIRKNRRIIHDQSLIQFFAVIALTSPIPLVTIAFWAVFGLASPVIIQGIFASWAASALIYVALAIYTRIRQGKL